MSLKKRTAEASMPSLPGTFGDATREIDGQAIRVCIAVTRPCASTPALIRTMLAGR